MVALGVPQDWMCLRLEIHSELRMPPSESRALSLLHLVRLHTILDKMDGDKKHHQAEMEKKMRARRARR